MTSEEAQKLYFKMLKDGAEELTAEELAGARAEIERLKTENAILRGLITPAI